MGVGEVGAQGLAQAAFQCQLDAAAAGLGGVLET